MAESKKLPNERWKPTHRHRTASPTGPSEKRVKYRAAVPQDLELPSHFPGCSLSPVSTTNPTSRSHSLTGPISTEDWSLIPTASASQSSDLIPLYDCDMSPQVNISQWNGAFDPMGGVDFTEMANSDQGTTYSNLLPNLPTSIPSFQIASRPFVLSDTRPADFLSIRRTQGR